jgi:dTDP-glucose pyrophosphorylase
MEKFQEHIISPGSTIQQALKQLNDLSENLTLFVSGEDRVLLGTLTDGDIRRGLLSGLTLNDTVEKVMYKGFRYLENRNYVPASIKSFRDSGILQLPVLDEKKRLIRIINLREKCTVLPLDAILMAGGKGIRLKPLTDSTPKPLLKVGSKTIIEHNIGRLSYYGIENIDISLGYLGHKIEEQVGNGSRQGVNIRYIHEDEPLGTIGAAKKTSTKEHSVILLMNSDLLTDIDFEDFYSTFIAENADMAVATIPYQQQVPYAVMEVDGNNVTGLKEKPTYTYYSNAGIYLIKRELLELIPDNTFYDATDLMENMIRMKKKLISCPILGYWLDIGKPDDFIRAQQDIAHLNFNHH